MFLSLMITPLSILLFWEQKRIEPLMVKDVEPYCEGLLTASYIMEKVSAYTMVASGS